MDIDLSRAVWHKSAFSNGSGGNCVEVARNLPGIVAVRDSKDRGGPVLTFTTPSGKPSPPASRPASST